MAPQPVFDVHGDAYAKALGSVVELAAGGGRFLIDSANALVDGCGGASSRKVYDGEPPGQRVLRSRNPEMLRW